MVWGSSLALVVAYVLAWVFSRLEAVQDGIVDQQTGLTSVQDEAALLTQLIEDLHHLAAGDAGRVILNLERVNVGDVVRRVSDGVIPEARAKRTDVAVVIPKGPQPVRVDDGRIGQVLNNLLANALSYTADGGAIRVEAAHVPSCSRTTGGRGVGLSIARQLVEAHGGTIRAESEPRRGSRFVFRLPADEQRS